jgi:hypothetical protein
MKTGSFGRLLSPLSALATLLAVGSSLAAPGDLYVSDVAGKQILKFTPDGSRTVFASDLDAVGPLAFDRAGNLFVTEPSQGTILKFAPDGTQTTFASGLSSPSWSAFDGAGNLFVAESFGDTGDILRFTPSGTKSTFATGGYFAGLCFDSLGNLVNATAGPTNPDGGIVYYSPDGTVHTFYETVDGPGVAGPGLAFASGQLGGVLYATSGDEILGFASPECLACPHLPAPIGGVFAMGLDGALSLALDGAGNLFVSESGNGSILKFAPPNAIRSTFASGLEGDAYLAFEPVTEKLRNISARGLVGTGDDVLIGGFIVGGNALANNTVVVRALGPSLTQGGVTNPLADPVLELRDASGALIAANDNWQDTQSGQITASGLAPGNPKESAIYATLSAGAYTAVVHGVGNATGVALVEVYSVAQ